jgi:hypothetical protein
VPVEGHPGAVVAHGGAGVGVAGGFLHVAERNPGVEGEGTWIRSLLVEIAGEWLIAAMALQT